MSAGSRAFDRATSGRTSTPRAPRATMAWRGSRAARRSIATLMILVLGFYGAGMAGNYFIPPYEHFAAHGGVYGGQPDTVPIYMPEYRASWAFYPVPGIHRDLRADGYQTEGADGWVDYLVRRNTAREAEVYIFLSITLGVAMLGLGIAWATTHA